MSTAIIVVSALLFSLAIVAIGIAVLVTRKNASAPSNTRGAAPTTSGQGGVCTGPWKKGGVLSFYDVFDPVDGDGSVAGLDFKPSKTVYDKENVVSVIERDWKKHRYNSVDIRFVKTPGTSQSTELDKVPVFTSKILDYCSDKDCGSGDTLGCCTRNLNLAKAYAGVPASSAALFDVEQRTLKRVTGSLFAKADAAGSMNVEYRICKPFSKSSLSKYKK